MSSDSSSSASAPGPSEASFWSKRWLNGGETQWHKVSVHPDLLRHRNFFGPSGRVLVPLCGKSIDLKYLYDEGFTVIGIEFIQSAIIDFFNENKTLFPSYHCNNDAAGDGSIESFSSTDGRLKIFRADIFSPSLTAALIGGAVDCVWDRGSLVAIDPKDRFKYWKKILQLGGVGKKCEGVSETKNAEEKNGFRILLNVVSYNQTEKQGPPFSVSHRQLSYLLKNAEDEGKEEGVPKSISAEEANEVVDGVIRENNVSLQLVYDEWYLSGNYKTKSRIYQIEYSC